MTERPLVIGCRTPYLVISYFGIRQDRSNIRTSDCETEACVAMCGGKDIVAVSRILTPAALSDAAGPLCARNQ